MSKDMQLTLRLNADGTAMIEGVKRADKAIDGLGKSADDTSKKIHQCVIKSKKLSSVASSIKNFALSFSGVATALGVGALVNTQREFDVLNSQLVTATGSTQAAKQAFNELTKFASRTPYALAQSVQGFTQLKNLGLDPSMRSMESYGNFASAMGKDLSQMIEAVADASTMEFERLKEFGIKAKQTQNEVQFTFQGTTTSVAKNSQAIQQYLLSIGETKFATAMANRMATLDGAISNLADNFNMLKLRIMQSGIGGFVETIIRGISSGLAWLSENIKLIGSTLKLFFQLMLGWAAYRYLPALMMNIATALRAWATAQTLLNAQMGAGLLAGYARNMLFAKGSIKQTAKALFSLKGAIGVASAAFVGWEIGTWARENFAVVRVVANGVVVKIVDAFDGVQTFLKQVFNHVKSFGVMAMNGIDKAMHWLVTKGKNAGLRIENAFKTMYLGLLKMTKTIIEKIGGAWKGLTAGINRMMATALTKVRDGLSGLTGFSVMGKKFDLIPDSVIKSLNGKISVLKAKGEDTSYTFDKLDDKINKLTGSIKANEKAIASNNSVHQKFVELADQDTLSSVSDRLKNNAKLAKERLARHQFNMDDIDAYMDYEINKEIADKNTKPATTLARTVSSEMTQGGNPASTTDKIKKGAKSAKDAVNELKRQLEAVANFKANQQQSIQDYAFETALIGKQADEVERLRFAHDNDWLGGMKAGLSDLAKSAGTTFDVMKNATTGAFTSMADGIANFVATGKGNFKELTASILADMSKMLVKAAMMKMFGALADTGGIIGSFFSLFKADGGAFYKGVEFYANGGVVNRPTAFAHAGGLGVMGEAGPEAIMPLMRGANGKLGVAVHNGKNRQAGMYNNITISVNVENGNAESSVESQQAQGRQLGESLDASVRAVLAREMRPGGMLSAH
ncbi:MAG: hypothetical protein KGV56_01340 [Gammaproteobacteria bacterium]|nr:hypothetical protein [Gammaproteobacteria bacterium]